MFFDGFVFFGSHFVELGDAVGMALTKVERVHLVYFDFFDVEIAHN